MAAAKAKLMKCWLHHRAHVCLFVDFVFGAQFSLDFNVTTFRTKKVVFDRLSWVGLQARGTR